MSIITSAPRAAASTAAGLVWPPPTRLAASRPENDEILAAAAAGPEDRVLVLGGERADLLCAALRRGCRSAIGLVAPERHPAPADVVVAPRVTTEADALAVADCARRALRGAARKGRLAIGLVGAGAGSLAQALGRGLLAYGFTRARLRARAEGGVLLLCEMPAGSGVAAGR
jgi:hypothetical protein